MIYSTEKSLKEHRDKIDDADAQKIEQAISAAREAVNGGSAEQIRKAVEDLTQSSHKLAEAMYAAQSSGPEPGSPDGASASPGRPTATRTTWWTRSS